MWPAKLPASRLDQSIRLVGRIESPGEFDDHRKPPRLAESAVRFEARIGIKRLRMQDEVEPRGPIRCALRLRQRGLPHLVANILGGDFQGSDQLNVGHVRKHVAALHAQRVLKEHQLPAVVAMEHSHERSPRFAATSWRWRLSVQQ